MVNGMRQSTPSDESLGHRQAVSLLEGWATDLVKIVGNFGNNLRQNPHAIDKLIAPFCPRTSATCQQFGRKKGHSLQVLGSLSASWDDCLARFSLEQGASAAAILATGSLIVVLATIQTSSHMIVYDAATFEEQRRLIHPERVLLMQVNPLGDLLATYGFLTTGVWTLATGNCIQVIKNPEDRPRPHSLRFGEGNETVLALTEDRCVRNLSVYDTAAPRWDLRSEIVEQRFEGVIHSFPKCSALSPDGAMVVLGYRNHPVTAWELSLNGCFANAMYPQTKPTSQERARGCRTSRLRGRRSWTHPRACRPWLWRASSGTTSFRATGRRRMRSICAPL